ncbi:MAG: hypothetical protein HXX09_09895 [Bacteroidetes bacterium]|nr:hypothetical protein [Bacteroidota bacterium]
MKMDERDLKFWIIGIGGFGGRSVDFLQGLLPEIEMFAIDSDEWDLNKLFLKNKILISDEIYAGRGSEHNSDVARFGYHPKSKVVEDLMEQNAGKKMFIISGLGLGTGSRVTPEIVKIANQFDCIPEVLSICYLLWGENKDPKGILKSCFYELHNLQCGVSYFDEEFIRKETGKLRIKDSFEKLCLILKGRLDDLLEAERILSEVFYFQNKGERWIAFIGLKNKKPCELISFKNGNYSKSMQIQNCYILKSIKKDNIINLKVEYVNNENERCTIENTLKNTNKEFRNYLLLISELLQNGVSVDNIYKTLINCEFQDYELNSWQAGILRLLRRYSSQEFFNENYLNCLDCKEGKLELIEGCYKCPICGYSRS